MSEQQQEDLEPYICLVCGDPFLSEDEMRAHEKREHGRESDE